MEALYLQFCQPGSLFYSRPLNTGPDFSMVNDAIPEGWRTSVDEVWCMRQPDSVSLPDQGWKIHVTAALGNAEGILRSVVAYCTEHELAFKFLRSPAMLVARNSKYADRSSSGKFITVYPCTLHELERTLSDLDELHGGSPGPAILTDVRWRSGPLFVRYGGFKPYTIGDSQGRLVPAIHAPSGDLVPDDRRPGFHPPNWVTIPKFLQSAISARNAGMMVDFPYAITAALHFSNGGGVYKGVDSNGHNVILKEARPYAGLDESGASATSRVIQEAEVLRTLAGIEGIPNCIELRHGYEHLFLVREFIDGTTLGELLLQRNPVINPDSPLTHAAFTHFVLDVCAQLRTIVEHMHERGVVYADLHPGNVLVLGDGRLMLIDFESCSRVADNAEQKIGVPGFRAPYGCAGPSVDEYALNVLLLASFFPLAQTLDWDISQPARIWQWVRTRFPVPSAIGESAVHAIQQAQGGTISHGELVNASAAGLDVDELVRFLLDSTDARHEERPYPGDIQQLLLKDARGFLYGSAGVIWTLQSLGAAMPPEHVSRFVDAVRDPSTLPAGFGVGNAGVSIALDALGEEELAERHRRAALASVQEDPSVMGGSAGIALSALLGVNRADLDLDHVAQHALAAFARASVAGLTGFFYGAEGIAVLMVRMFEATGDEQWLDRASQIIDGFVSEPCANGPALLCSPSVGRALAARLLQAYRPSNLQLTLIDAVRGTGEHSGRIGMDFVEHAGVLRGRAGVLLSAYALWEGEPIPQIVQTKLDSHIKAMWLHAVRRKNGLGILGDDSLRLSLDYATGSAGVIHSLSVEPMTGFPLFRSVSL